MPVLKIWRRRKEIQVLYAPVTGLLGGNKCSLKGGNQRSGALGKEEILPETVRLFFEMYVLPR
jgi:hypothetical protein